MYFFLDGLDTSLTFGFYEMLHNGLEGVMPSEKGKLNLGLSLVSSSLAASFTAGLSNPCDVI